jgi:hypothetical protein
MDRDWTKRHRQSAQDAEYAMAAWLAEQSPEHDESDTDMKPAGQFPAYDEHLEGHDLTADRIVTALEGD